MTPAELYLNCSSVLIDRVRAQLPLIQKTADLFAATILAGQMVHVFGSGHSRILVEEMWPRYGSFPGFNPIVELSLTFHNLVVGCQRAEAGDVPRECQWAGEPHFTEFRSQGGRQRPRRVLWWLQCGAGGNGGRVPASRGQSRGPHFQSAFRGKHLAASLGEKAPGLCRHRFGYGRTPLVMPW